MTKTKKSKTEAAATIQPWSCVHQEGKSQIQAYVMATGQHEVLAEIASVPGYTAEAMAEFIVNAVNNFDKRERLIEEMKSALETCLESGGLNWAAEHDADVVLRRVNGRV
jgi:hypothetical protein